ncbi:MAG: hypothetical protein D3923_08035 [Candidatus Electrothrix sp. AR3]|nr:hypothetical protein [Candidatus Electrothrix sp. AR3]
MEHESKKLIVSHDEKILFFPIEFFKEFICSGERCFICGKLLNKVESNAEHILPNWLLKKFNLHNQKITLTNGTKFKYSHYKIPCCIECNSFLGANVESPIQKLLSSGYEGVSHYIQKNGTDLIIVWLSLIFFKTHFKDLSLRMTLDRSKCDDTMVGDEYDWESIHHIYSLARSIYVNAQIDKSAFSSLFILPIDTFGNEHFDYCDLYPTKSILLQYNDIALIANLNDGCAALAVFEDEFKRIKFPISGFQVREFFARVSYINTLLESETKFVTQINSANPSGIIKGHPPSEIICKDGNPSEFGLFFYALIKEILDNITEIDSEKHQLIKEGKWTFLFCQKNDSVIY